MRASTAIILVVLTSLLSAAGGAFFSARVSRQSLEEATLGLRALRLPTPIRNSVRLDFVFEPKPACMVGTLDALRVELGLVKKKEVLLSLEPLDGNGPAVTDRTTLKELQAGLRHSFTIKAPQVPKNYGLFVCMDQAGRGGCQGKPAESSNRTMALYTNPRKPLPKSYKPKDKVYFFQYFLLERTKLHTLTLPGMTHESFSALTSYLRNREAGQDPAKAIKLVRDMASTFGTTSANPGPVAMKVRLGYFDPKECMSSP